MHINNHVEVDVEQVIDTFAQQNPRRMKFLDVLDDHEDRDTKETVT
jgi:hypothetical protein